MTHHIHIGITSSRPSSILAIDPGPEFSAYVNLCGPRVTEHGKLPNGELLDLIRAIRGHAYDAVAIEMIASYGMPVGAEVFETCVYIGRLCEALGREPIRIKRIEVKSHLCHSAKAKDSNVRAALLDRYGGKDKAIGKKAAPGPLYGVTADEWQALAVAVTVADRLKAEACARGAA